MNEHHVRELTADRDALRKKCERLERALRESEHYAIRWRACAERLRRYALGDMMMAMRDIALAEFDQLSSANGVPGEPATAHHVAHRQHADDSISSPRRETKESQ